MALGGGKFISQNKVMPGTYINFVSAARASASLSDRGVAAMAFELDWGKDREVFTVTSSDFQNNSIRIFGYEYSHPKLIGLRELFRNIHTLQVYKLNQGGEKAFSDYGTAVCSGVRGNEIRIVVAVNSDDDSKFDVKTYFENRLMETQTVGGVSELVDNGFVSWNREYDLSVEAGVNFSGGSNGNAPTAACHQEFLNVIQSYDFNTIGVVSEEVNISHLYTSFCKRMRDEMGVKFQAVVWNEAADYEGCVNVLNTVNNPDFSRASLVYWVTGALAACGVNASLLNKIYDGEFDVNVNYTQSQLEKAIKNGEFMLHKAGNSKRVLSDINSLITVSDEKGNDFKENQTIRVLDQIANDIATIFNERYLGRVQNDDSGRISLWNDIVKHHQELLTIRAIEDFLPDDVSVEAGDTKRGVKVIDRVTPVNAMTQLYMTVYVQ